MVFSLFPLYHVQLNSFRIVSEAKRADGQNLSPHDAFNLGFLCKGRMKKNV
jgi:hypothetical protein